MVMITGLKSLLTIYTLGHASQVTQQLTGIEDCDTQVPIQNFYMLQLIYSSQHYGVDNTWNPGRTVTRSNLNSLYKSNTVPLDQVPTLQGFLLPTGGPFGWPDSAAERKHRRHAVLMMLDSNFRGKNFDCPMSTRVPQYFFNPHCFFLSVIKYTQHLTIFKHTVQKC